MFVVLGATFLLWNSGGAHHTKGHRASSDQNASGEENSGGDGLLSTIRSALGLSGDKDRRKGHGSSSDESTGRAGSLRGDDPASGRYGGPGGQHGAGGAQGGGGGDSILSGSNGRNAPSGEPGLGGALGRVFGGGAAGGKGAGAPAGPPPCSSAGQGNCTPCTGGTSEPACTPTEAVIAQNDLDRGVLPNDPDKSCFGCLTAKGCLSASDQCESLSLPGTPGFSETAAQLCRDILSCAFRTHCAKTLAVECYCGDAPVTGACQTGGADGACLEEIVSGAYAVDPKGVLKALGQTGTPAGLANSLLQCAGPAMNDCPACLN